MRRVFRAALCAMLLSLLTLTASAAVTKFDVTALDVRVTVSEDASYRAVMTATLAFDGADTALTLPLGPNVTGAEAAGFSTALSREDGVYFLTLSTRESFVVPGTYTVSWTGTLPYTTDEETGTSAELPLLCAQWPGSVAGVQFCVEMPQSVPAGSCALSSGYYGELTGEGVTVEIAEKTVSGALSTALLDHESLTLQWSLPADYFAAPGAVAQFFAPGRMIVPLLALLAALYWFFTLRSPRTRCRTQVVPPDGVCAGDIPFLLYGARPDAALTIVQWASLGYLAIRPARGGALLTRTMGMGNERKGYERRLFAALFAHADTVRVGGPEFRRVLAQVETPLARHWQRRMFDRRSGSPALLRLIAVVACAVACGRAGLAIDQIALPRAALCALLGAAGALGGVASCRGALCAVRRQRVALVALGGAATVAMLLLGGLTGVRVGTMLACAMALFSGFTTAHGGRRTRQGSDMLAKLRSLRAFLSTAEPKQLRRQIAQDPQYYYRMLPFAEALGVGAAFAARFGETRLEPCEYYPTRTQATAPAFYQTFSRILGAM